MVYYNKPLQTEQRDYEKSSSFFFFRSNLLCDRNLADGQKCQLLFQEYLRNICKLVVPVGAFSSVIIEIHDDGTVFDSYLYV